jgi:hypothetical protein
MSGPIFDLPGGKAYAAIGVDFRTEEYAFNGDQRVAAERSNILGAPFDQANVLSGVSRDVKAVFAEMVSQFWTIWSSPLPVASTSMMGLGAQPIQNTPSNIGQWTGCCSAARTAPVSVCLHSTKSITA